MSHRSRPDHPLPGPPDGGRGGTSSRLFPRILTGADAREMLGRSDRLGPASTEFEEAVRWGGARIVLLRTVEAASAPDLVLRISRADLTPARFPSAGGEQIAVACAPGRVPVLADVLEGAGEPLASALLARACRAREGPPVHWRLRLPRGRFLDLGGGRMEIMGVVNVTPDSFYAASRSGGGGRSVLHARELAAQGAAVVDIGGESTRPGSRPVEPAEEIGRVVPVIAGFRDRDPRTPLSVDTRRAAVAEAALDAGADIINDVSGGRDDPELLDLAAERGVPLVLMHMKGSPSTMQREPAYDDVVGEVALALWGFRGRAVEAGVGEGQVVLDPGIGFGKTADHNLSLLRGARSLMDMGSPLLLGTSRKSFLGRVLALDDPADRLAATLATVALAARDGVAMVRVHDVEAARQVAGVVAAVRGAPLS